MKLYLFMLVSVLFILTMLVPLAADAGLVKGSKGRAEFEKFRWSHLDMFVDFENLTNGPYTKLPGLKLNTTQFRWPRPIVDAPASTPVILLPYDYVQTSPGNNRLMGAVKVSRIPDYIPDGQSKYEIVFDNCLLRVGLLRMWNTYSTTSFFNGNRKVATHRNTSNEEFVGYIASSIEDTCITRVELDGHYTEEYYGEDLIKFYQVGSVDDLFYSTPSIELNIQFEPNPDNDKTPRIKAGESITAIITIKNIASYINENIGIEVAFINPKLYEEVKFKISKDIPAEETLTLKYVLETDHTTPQHFYPMIVKIYSRVDEFIMHNDRSFYVDNPEMPTAPTSSILQLLLAPDSD